MAYARLPVAFTPQQLLDDAVAFLIDQGWDPQTGTVEAWLLEAFSRMIHRLGVAAALMPDEAMRVFGAETIGVAVDAGAAATVPSTWTMRDTAGHTIAEGTVVALGPAQRLFRVAADVVIAPGSASTSAGGVLLEAAAAGAGYNQIPAGSATPVITDPDVLQVVTTAATSGGADPETATEYLNRLTEELTLLTRVPRLAGEFALVARRVSGVHRARDFPGYDADTSTPDTPGHVTVAVVDADGAAVSGGVKTAVETELTSGDRRALNIVVHVVDPTLQAITVTFTAVAEADADPVTVEETAEADVEAYLNPGTWAGGAEDPPAWRAVDTVRYLEVAAVLNAVPGLDYVTALTLDGGTADVPLVGLAVLPDPTVTGTVS